MTKKDADQWLVGWKDIGSYVKRSPKTAQRWEKRYGLPIMRVPSERPIASRLHIDKWLIDMNKENFEMGIWKHPGIDAALGYEHEREQERKDFEERLIHAQRRPRGLF